MKSSLLVVATAIIFGLIGSQVASLQTKPSHKGQKCADDNCKVMVMVGSWCLTCDVSVDYEMSEAKGHNINFEIDQDSTPRYEFPTNGIVFDGGFTCQKKNSKRFECTNLNPTKPGVYKYTVTVTDSRYQKNLDPLDPWVVN